MVTEIAVIEVRSGQETDFEKAMTETVDLLLDGEGCAGVRLVRGVEHPSRYQLFITWESVAHHERYRETPGFQQWRGHVGPFFAGAPQMEHVEDVLDR